MKKILSLLVLALMAVSASAIPAKRVVKTVTQADGTTLQVVLQGDETFHFMSTTDGLPIVMGQSGSYEYANVYAGKLVPSNCVAHNAPARGADEVSFLAANAEQLQLGVKTLHAQKAAKRQAQRVSAEGSGAKKMAAKKVSYTGTKKGLVILVNFSDKKMSASDPQVAFDNQFNQKGYSKNKHIGSVQDYYYDQSYGQFTLEFDVVGPYTLSKKMAYYGTNDSDGNDQYAGTMVAEACQMAAGDVDYADYDWDGDGYVDQVYVIYAGYGEAQGASENTIWPHEWQLQYSDYGKILTLDGKKIDTYACSNELAGTTGTQIDGIGTACHEFCHCLGLPDFYDTNYKAFGMDAWDLMDYGAYNGPDGYEGSVPAAFTSYERMFAGWITPTVLSEGCEVTDMEPITTKGSDTYIIYNDNNEDEYYLLENHQQKSWDAYAGGHGLLVLHVDYDENVWYANEVNNTKTHQRMTIIAADNKYTSATLSGDPFPGTSSKTALTNSTTPAATLYNANTDGKKYLNKPIEEITESNGLISFVFNGGTPVEAPVAYEATDLSMTDDGNSFTAHWSTVSGAESYILQLNEVNDNAAQVVVSQDFMDVFDDEKSYMSGSCDGDLDDLLDTTGWTGHKIFNGYNSSSGEYCGLKIGSGKEYGYITTPTYSAPETGTLSIYVSSKAYNTSGIALVVTVSNASGTTLHSETISEAGETVITVEGITQSYNVTVSTTTSYKRAYLCALAIYDGETTLDEIQSSEAKPRKAEAQTITDLTTTQYTFTGLTANHYTYKVKAVVDGHESPWSNKIDVYFDADAISAVAAEMLSDESAEIYTASGIRVASGNQLQQLPRGTYVVKTANGTQKIVK